MTFQEIVEQINGAFFRFEGFMNLRLYDYEYFGFTNAFTALFMEGQKPENYTYINRKLIGEYWRLTEQIRIDYDNGDFKNVKALENEMFRKDWEEIEHLNWERVNQFEIFTTLTEIDENDDRFSIIDILKAMAENSQLTKKIKFGERQKDVYNFDKVKQHIATLDSTQQKIIYLMRIKTDFQQNKFGWNDNVLETPFDEKCDLEIEMLREILELEQYEGDSQQGITPPPETKETELSEKISTKHYVLSYLIECNAKGESFPIGQKKELEKIGNRIMGVGKGNRFYKVFNEIVGKDINAENDLIEIGGENWRAIIKSLSSEPETIETYLKSKQL